MMKTIRTNIRSKWIRSLSFAFALLLSFGAHAQVRTDLKPDQRKILEAYGVCEKCLPTANPSPLRWPYLQKLPTAAAWAKYTAQQKAPKANPPPNQLRWGSHLLAYTPNFLKKLYSVATKEALVARAQDGRRPRAGNVSKGMCMQAVMDVLIKTGVLDQRIWTDAAAARTHFEALRYPNGKPQFVNIVKEVGADPLKAPVGSILIYDDVTPGKRKARRYGHIEVKVPTPDKKVIYSSDHYKTNPISSDIQTRKLRAVFLKLSEQS